MDLHGIVRGAINAINPDELVTVKVSAGPGPTARDGSRQPQYRTFTNVVAQVQPVDGEDLEHLDALNLQGTMMTFFLHGEVAAIVRARQKGGDLVTRANGTEWLVTQVNEQWPDWCKVIGTLQNDGG